VPNGPTSGRGAAPCSSPDRRMGRSRMPSAMASVRASSTWVRVRRGPSIRTWGVVFPSRPTSVTISLEANSPGCRRSRSCVNLYPGPNSFSRSSWQTWRCRAETPIGISAFSDCAFKPLMPYISTSRSTLVTTLRTLASTCALSSPAVGKMSRRCAHSPHVSQSPTRLLVVLVVSVIIAIHIRPNAVVFTYMPRFVTIYYGLTSQLSSPRHVQQHLIHLCIPLSLAGRDRFQHIIHFYRPSVGADDAH